MVSRIESREVESSSMYLTNICNSSVESIYPIHNSVVGGSVISSSIVNSGGSNPFQVDPTHTRIQLRSQGPASSGKYSYTNQLLALDRCKPLNRKPLPRECQQIVTPLKWKNWFQALRDHHDREYVGYIIKGLQEGFRIGFDYTSHGTSNPLSSIQGPSMSI